MEQIGNVSNSPRSNSISDYDSLKAVQNLEDRTHPEVAVPASGPRFSLGQRPIGPAHYVPRAQSAELLERLKHQPATLIEVIGPSGVGKTTLLQRLMYPCPDPFFASYDLIAWIDCSSVSRAHADIQAINHELGHRDLSPQAALRQLATYVKQHPRSLLILDGVAASDIEFILGWVKPFFGLGQLIYTTTQPLSDTLSESLERPVHSLSLNLFSTDQAKQLVQQCLPKESLKDGDFSQLIQMTGGYPGVIKALCRHYQSMIVGFKDFADFLAQSPKHQGKREALLGEIAKASLESLEKQALTDPIAARALMLLKQAAWLGDHPIPFAFFVDEEQQVDSDAIQMLHDKKLAMLEIDRETQSLKLNSAFVSAVQKQSQSAQHLLLEKNIQRLSEVFSYLTNNEGKQGRGSEPGDLNPYADLVHTLLFETCVKPSSPANGLTILSQTLSLSENKLTVLHQVLALGSSLARLYYLYHGKWHLAYDRLQKAQHFFKQGLSEVLISHFEQAPDPKNFTPRSISDDEAQLLKLYSQEYLYQAGTLASQLIQRGQVPITVIQNFEKSYAIQVNLGKHVDPPGIAYTLQNLARALRKQSLLINALETYDKLKQWMEQHPTVFDEVTRAKLLVDQGIIEKELEDAKPEAERNYQVALVMLRNTRAIYLSHGTATQHRNLGMLSIYLGETYLAAGEFELGIQHTCQILYYSGENRQNQARAYFNLARALDEAGFGALAKLFIDQAKELQIKAYQSATEALRLKIDKKLVERYQQTESLVPMNQWETRTDLAEHCRKSLVDSSAPSQRLSREQIQDLEGQAYNWLWRHHDKTTLEAKRVEIAEEITKLDTAEKEAAEKRAVQRQQDEQWYRGFALRVQLDNPDARSFAKQFKEKLRNEVVQQLRLVNEEPMPMGKAESAEGFVQALSSVLPQIQLGSATGVTATIDLPAIIQGATQILSERRRRRQNAEATRMAETLDKPKQQPKSLEVYDRIKQEIDEMADYAARCWQPVFAAHTSWPEQDIQALAEDGVHRLMNYLKAGKVDELSHQERVVFALMQGETHKRLSVRKEGGTQLKGHWSTQGFFAKPGIKVEIKKEFVEFYFPTFTKAHPRVYGYRLGSPVEGRVGSPLYKGAFKSETDAQQKAEEVREQQTRCVVM